MKISSLLTLFILIFLSFHCKAEEIIPEVIATVNDSPVTSQDVKYRFTLLNLKREFSEQEFQEIYPYIIQQLIDETLMLQQGKKLGLKIDPVEMKTHMEEICSNFGVDYKDLNSFLKEHSISKNHLEKQVEAQLIWSQIITQVIKPKVDISNKRVADLLSYSFPQDAMYTYAVISASDFTKNSVILDKSRKNLNGCMNVQSVTDKLGKDFEYRIEFDKTYKELPSYIRDTLVFLSTGYPSHVIKGNKDNAVLVILCNREFSDSNHGDKHDEVLEKQMSILVQNYLMSMRRKAVIDMMQDN